MTKVHTLLYLLQLPADIGIHRATFFEGTPEDLRNNQEVRREWLEV